MKIHQLLINSFKIQMDIGRIKYGEKSNIINYRNYLGFFETNNIKFIRLL